MSPIVSVSVSLLTLVLGWTLNEVSHRWRSRDEEKREARRQHVAGQTTALVELQRVALDYYAIASRALWLEWARVDEPEDSELEEEATEMFGELEPNTMELFAARARVDDLRIRSFVDYLEEMGGQFVAVPGETVMVDGERRHGVDVVSDNDRALQDILNQLNNYIGARMLELVGVHDPETPPYRGE